MRLIPILVERSAQIERVLVIRNITRAGYAHHNAEISIAEHLAWWARAQPLAWLYQRADDGIVVGFGMLRKDEQARWVTVVGVLPEHTGHNYGKEITRHLVRRCPGLVWGTARRDNPAAMRLHTPDDWLEIPGDDPRLVYFRTIKADTWPPDQAIEAWSEEGWSTCR